MENQHLNSFFNSVSFKTQDQFSNHGLNFNDLSVNRKRGRLK